MKQPSSSASTRETPSRPRLLRHARRLAARPRLVWWNRRPQAAPRSRAAAPEAPGIAQLEIELRPLPLEVGQRRVVDVDAKIAGKKRRLRRSVSSHLLLLLAQRYLRDRAAGEHPDRCGWIWVPEALDALHTHRLALNTYVHRIRRRFEAIGLPDASGLVERRLETDEIRIAGARVRVVEARQ